MAFSWQHAEARISSSSRFHSSISGSLAKIEEKEPYTATAMVLRRAASRMKRESRKINEILEPELNAKARYRCSSVGKRISAVTADAFSDKEKIDLLAQMQIRQLYSICIPADHGYV